jgi:16S rRNA (cytosine967-C5)-methyltransferase
LTAHFEKGIAMNVRQTALTTLTRCDRDGSYSNLALDAAIKAGNFSSADRGLLTALVYGVIERRMTLDYLIDCLSDRKPDQIDPQVRNILRLGLYQLRYMDRIPPHAAINESVSLASRKSAGFINALLRAYQRRSKEITLPTKEDGILPYLSVRYSFPIPLCERFIRIFGEERAERVLAAFAIQPPLTIRVNTLKQDRDTLVRMLSTPECLATPSDLCPTAIRLDSTAPLREGIEQGLFFVQDIASQLCVRTLDVNPGDTVIDACCCPGSKSFGAAIDMNNQGRVLCFDLHQNKLSLVSAGAERLGISILQTNARDSRTFDPSLVGIADRVLCDVPCSGFGVIAKKPEIRYKDPAESAALPDIQLAILENNCRYVKNGGVLVYSTCTIFPEENEQNIARFLSSHPEFTLESFTHGEIRAKDGMLTLTPDEHGTDGFFIAKLRKKSL